MTCRTALLAPVAVAAFLAVSASAFGQLGPREFPLDTRFGRMTHLQESMVDLDGTATRLSPAAVILGIDGLSIVPSVLPPQAAVRYRADFNGQINRVWVLTEQEAALARNPSANVRNR